MTDHAKLTELFMHCLELSRQERADYLDEACGDDPHLRAEVESLLDQDDASSKLLDGQALSVRWEDVLRTGTTSAIDVEIPGFEIEAVLGQGGMGRVLLARQLSPRRTVAIKILHGIHVSSEMTRRFQQEAEALARLQHPGIAQIHVASTYDVRGQAWPYLCMEYVPGDDLRTHAEKTNATLEQRVRWVRQTCDALEHAHRQGVIHRDLKPENILMDAADQPKVVDFGIARLLGDDVEFTRAVTEHGQLVGTLAYMSPEQLSGDPTRVGRRSDVHSLGVILYVLVTGRLPIDVSGLSIPQAIRKLTETGVSSLPRGDRRLRGDLAVILQTATSKELASRYRSMADFGADLQRYLDGEPIEARAPSRLYLSRKFVQRHRVFVIGVTFVIATLIAALAVSLHHIRRTNTALLESEAHAYLATISAADSAVQLGDLVEAGRLLDAVDARHRGWEWHHLHSRLDASLVVLTSDALTVALAPDGTRYWLCLRDGTVIEGDPSNPSPTRAWSLGASAPIREACLCVPRRAIVLRMEEETRARLRVHDLGTGAPLGELDVAAESSLIGMDDRTGRVCFAGPRTVGVWNVASGRVDTRERSEAMKTWDVRGGTLLSANRFGQLRWLSLEEPDAPWKEMREKQPANQFSVIRLSEDGRRALVGVGQRLRQVDLASKTVSEPFGRHRGEVASLAFTPDPNVVLSAADDETIRAWNPNTGRHVDMRGGQPGRIDQIVPGGPWFLTRSEIGECRLWRIEDEGSALHGLGAYVYDVSYAPDGSFFVSASWDHALRLWDPNTMRRLRIVDFRSNDLPRFYPFALSVSPRGDQIAVGGSMASILIVDIATGQQHRIQVGNGRVGDVAFFPDGRRVLLGRDPLWPQQVKAGAVVCDAKLETVVALPEDDDGPTYAVAIASSGASFATGNQGGRVHLWSGEDRRHVATYDGHAAPVRSLAFTNDEALIASGDEQGVILVRSATSGAVVHRLEDAHFGTIWDLCFTRDGSRLFAACHDGFIRVFDARRGVLITRLQGHEDYVKAIALSPDDSQLVSGSGDGTVRVWDTLRPRERWNRR